MRQDQRSAEALEWRKLYRLPQWRGLRLHQLAQHPLCQRCSRPKHPVAADTVNHQTPHKGDLALFLDPANLMSVCKACHDGPIQFEERRGYSRAVGLDGFPTDPRHPSIKPRG